MCVSRVQIGHISNREKGQWGGEWDENLDIHNSSLVKTNFRSLFMDGVQLSQGYRATTRR